MTINGSKPLWATTVLVLTLLGWGANKAYEHLVADSSRTSSLEQRLTSVEADIRWIRQYLEDGKGKER